ncbi:hypothetical protein E0H22_15820 [Rhodopseudomonas boonkerdii]|uniref:GrlR family regulatory protein n=1 Tax=Rhodopseudomonas boonkerdii TaxID=475937 RepID=UPI001E51FF22|nr:GrlR family regulatory protein [Rhodopseudomonas boonkerdii]UGV27026.1 hypothetical protein E0H22_15820 [Rhodopseudomonas boonkerdii]
MRTGFYKCEYYVGEALGRSVMYVRDGTMLGGNSGFAHIGAYRFEGDQVFAEIESRRHCFEADYQSLLGQDIATIKVIGRACGDTYRFEGSSPQMPGASFRSLMTNLDDSEMPPAGEIGEGSIANGLYSIHLRALDGIDGGLTGVMLLQDGRILGGDASFYYLGAYSSADGRWKGEILNQEHTPSLGEVPIFGGYEIGIGFSGSCDPEGAELEATALAGKRSLRLQAVLKLIRKAV